MFKNCENFGKKYGITRERARQIVNYAMRKISKSSYAESLKEYLDNDAYELKEGHYVLKNNVDDSIKVPFMYIKTIELTPKDKPIIDYDTYLSFLDKYDETMISQMNKEFIRSEYIKM